MDILSHRGLWLNEKEKNTEVAFIRSFASGFGTETDVRDCAGQLVISHDPATGAEMTLTHFLTLLGDASLPLALNIKADGLAGKLCHVMAGFPHIPWFVFDMSIPDTRHQLRVGNPVYVRMSEVERAPPWLERVEGIWLDGFDDTWWTSAIVQGLLGQGKKVCVVSPELHGRDPHTAWRMLRPLAAQKGLSICTDLPNEASQYFWEVLS